LAAIMEDRNATTPVKTSIIATTPTVPIQPSRKKKTKKSIGGFLREMEALV